MRLSTLVALSLSVAACSKSASAPSTNAPEPEGREPSATGGDVPAPGGATDERPRLTAPACEAQGGKVVGDIGDGAIHRPEYRCPDSGEPPIGTIEPEAGGPVAVEGAVCCK
jgi:hypothetical protein